MVISSIKNAFRPLYWQVMSLLPMRARVSMDYFRAHGRWPNLRQPETYTEKMLWRKLYDRDDRLPDLVDKVRCKEFIATHYGAQFVIPSLAVYEKADEIDFDALIPPYIIKANHGSDMNIFLLNSGFNREMVRSRAAKFLRTDFASHSGDWAYSRVGRKLLVEPYVAPGGYMIDYKFHVFGGKVFAVHVVHDRLRNYRSFICDRNYKVLDVMLRGRLPYRGEIKTPKMFGEMVDLAERIGRAFTHVRVDLYEVHAQVKVGELTFYSGGGYDLFVPAEWDVVFGQQWDLPIHRLDPPWSPDKFAVAKIERILIYRLASMGDTVVSLPCFHSIRQCYPTARIALLTAHITDDASAISAATLLEGTGLVDHYISYPENTRDLRKLHGIKREVQAFDPRLLVYLAAPRGLRNTYRDYLFFRWCGVRHFKGVPFTRDLRQIRQPKTGSYLWESEAHRLARCIAPLTTDVACKQNWSLCLSDQELGTALQLLRPNTKCLGLATGARQAAKDWGVENWQAVLAGIANPALTLVLIGAATDRDRSNHIATGWPGPIINLCGETSPRISAAVIKHLVLLVCHDGGPMHLAAAVGTRCVAVFGTVNQPGQWYPFGADHNVLHPGLPGSNGSVQPSEVINAVQEALAAARPVDIASCDAPLASMDAIRTADFT